jgi:hypothetical protein
MARLVPAEAAAADSDTREQELPPAATGDDGAVGVLIRGVRRQITAAVLMVVGSDADDGAVEELDVKGLGLVGMRHVRLRSAVSAPDVDPSG